MEEPPAIQKLRDAGLKIQSGDDSYRTSDPFADERDGTPPQFTIPSIYLYRLCKPSSAGGNSRFGRGCYVEWDDNGTSYSRYLSSRDAPKDAFHVNSPEATISTKINGNGEWYFGVHTQTFGGDRRPGDFLLTFADVDGAVDAALEYYFDNSLMMNPPDLFFREVQEYVWWPVATWFGRNWDSKFERQDLTFASIFTLMFWWALFERPIDQLIVLYYRIRYENPYPYYVYRHFLHKHVGFRTESTRQSDGSYKTKRYLQIRTVVKCPAPAGWPRSSFEMED